MSLNVRTDGGAALECPRCRNWVYPSDSHDDCDAIREMKRLRDERVVNPPPYPHYVLSRHTVPSDGYEILDKNRSFGMRVIASSVSLPAAVAALRLLEAQTVWRFTQRGDCWDMAPMRFDDPRLALEGDGR